jgi:hypothetical protein
MSTLTKNKMPSAGIYIFSLVNEDTSNTLIYEDKILNNYLKKRK